MCGWPRRTLYTKDPNQPSVLHGKFRGNAA